MRSRAANNGAAREPHARNDAPIRPQRDIRRLATRCGYALLFGIGALAIVGVPLNALYFQEGRHPAPFFATTAQVAEAPPSPPTRPAEITQPRPEPVKARPEPLRPAPTAAVVRVDNPRPQKQKGADTKKDPIAQLLGGDAKQKGPAESDVLFAQRALLRLGYVVRADGRMTGATRKAIEKFERDAGLPAKGEINPRLLARLAARAGLESE
jgi:hypothetical protein